jgi:hypothetical protein
MPTQTSTRTIFRTVADTIRTRKGAGQARRRRRSEVPTINTPSVRNELQAIQYEYPSELSDESYGR